MSPPREITFLGIKDVLTLHESLIRRYGGDQGLRDVGLLESAVAVAQAGFGGQYLHEFPAEMAAAYLFHLTRNHAFVDGNKRVGLAAAILFLKLNGVRYRITQEEAYTLTLGVASSALDKGAVVAFFRSHLVATPPSEA